MTIADHLTNMLLFRISDLWHRNITSARQKGRFAIVTMRRPGCGGRGSVGARREAQGGETRERPRVSRDRHGAVTAASLASRASARQPANIRWDRPRTEKSCGPDARRWRQALR